MRKRLRKKLYKIEYAAMVQRGKREALRVFRETGSFMRTLDWQEVMALKQKYRQTDGRFRVFRASALPVRRLRVPVKVNFFDDELARFP